MAKKTQTKKNKSKKKVNTEFSFDNPLIQIGLILIILAIISYFLLGLFPTVILIVGIAMIIGISKLFEKVKSNKKKRKLLNICLIAFLTLCIIGCGLGCLFIFYVVDEAPKFRKSQLYKPESSIIYDREGNIITKLGTEMREKVSYDELPQILIDAIVATEDSRFYQHNGFDAPRFLKASLGQVAGRDSGGASTLSMQLVKNTFTNPDLASGFKGIARKFTDIYLAIFKLEKNYTKEEIFEFYINNHYLGGSIYGVEQASQAYFGKSVKEINLSEAAILAGMFKSPGDYAPTIYPENAEKRRSTVLYLMTKHGYITKEEAELADSIPVASLVNENTNLKTSEFQGFIDTIVAELDAKLDVNPYTTPLLVYTTMDRNKQVGVNQVMNGETFNWKDDVVQSGVAVLDTHSGQILAIGNGRNKKGPGTWNYATQSKRHPGSSAKPLFDYGPGMEFNNWSTYTLFDDEPYSYTGGKQIQNWDGKFNGLMTLRTALKDSRNIPALKAFQQVDNKKIISFVTSLGITPEVENGKIHEAHSLGAFTGVSPLQMSAAYAAFANGGYYYEPYSVTKVVFRDTNKTYEYKSEKVKVMKESTAFMITSVLQDVNLYGSIPGVTFARKTGTSTFDTQTIIDRGLPSTAINDSWVVGYTPNISMAMWYGYDKPTAEYCSREPETSNLKNKAYLAFGKAVFDKYSTFTAPSSVIRVPVEFGTNPAKLPSDDTPKDKIVNEWFIKGTEPTEVSDTYKKLEAPKNFKATYDEKTKKVTLTWDKVNGTSSNDTDGAFGYYLSKDDKEITFTEKNTYTFDSSKPEGTYKIVAGFKNNKEKKSAPTEYKLKLESEEETTYSASLKDNKYNETRIKEGSSYTIPTGKDIIVVYEESQDKKEDITSRATIENPTIVDEANQKITNIDTTKKGTYTISYKVVYKTFTKTISIKLIIE